MLKKIGKNDLFSFYSGNTTKDEFIDVVGRKLLLENMVIFQMQIHEGKKKKNVRFSGLKADCFDGLTDFLDNLPETFETNFSYGFGTLDGEMFLGG